MTRSKIKADLFLPLHFKRALAEKVVVKSGRVSRAFMTTLEER